ncbi:polysaccharide biosynthesis/export family protein [Pontibacter anaerobius]|uniref:Polysaccharide biosynthesis/export family protein n=1 Tax=Pontibacter anaerobius TaxID=2993940 RepID=A0ABT3REG1_9BACT|nr:polysaccharide biosynthesis/export family protein [Pontibacter anaerobius]MCX2739947.1 polysaccharide biosynthesis/export family protein [Pontibacter anaerobius]
MRIKLIFILCLFCLTSCGRRNLAYFSDLQDKKIYSEKISNKTEPKIQADDLLSITVNSLNPEANTLFNRGVITPIGRTIDFSVGGSPNIDKYNEGYLVDKNGYIEFPVLGKLKVGGLTKQEASDMIEEELNDYLKEPTTTIRYLNFRVSVIGEVNRPSTFTIPTEKITILEALGMAGDMTAFGKRENVLVIREEGGIRTMARVNLNNKDVLNSPYFYLQQSDVVYVEPDEKKEIQASTNTRNISLALAAISLASLFISRIL